MADPSSVAAALGLPEVRTARRMAGFDATVWRVELIDGRTIALRLLRPGVDPAHEAEALALARRHTELAPAMLAHGHCDGRAAFALEWLPGSPMAELLGAGDPDRLGRQFGAAQRALHRRVDGVVLCHLDYQPFNVLADHTGVTGIVDWANARHGDPRADLAQTAVTLELGPAVVPDLAGRLPAFAAAWRVGYGAFPGEEELRPFLAAAAARQHGDWARRDAVPAGIRERAAEIAARHS